MTNTVELIKWLYNFTTDDFKVAKYGNINEKLELKNNKQLFEIDYKSIKEGDYFLLDSPEQRGYFCLVQRIKNKDVVINNLCEKSFFQNYSNGCFEIPKEIIKNF